nr:hypothetical protein [Tanacetum cinerariifolium]
MMKHAPVASSSPKMKIGDHKFIVDKKSNNSKIKNVTEKDNLVAKIGDDKLGKLKSKSNSGSHLPSRFSTMVDDQSSRLSTNSNFQSSGSLDSQISKKYDQTNQQQAESNYRKEDAEKQMVDLDSCYWLFNYLFRCATMCYSLL